MAFFSVDTKLTTLRSTRADHLGALEGCHLRKARKCWVPSVRTTVFGQSPRRWRCPDRCGNGNLDQNKNTDFRASYPDTMVYDFEWKTRGPSGLVCAVVSSFISFPVLLIHGGGARHCVSSPLHRASIACRTMPTDGADFVGSSCVLRRCVWRS
jgi:hypothetical protein